MKKIKANLEIVEQSDRLEYPIPENERLESHFFIPWHFNRWLNSDFRLKADADVRAYAFDLFCISQNQSPVGTLPMDDELLARLLMLDLGAWHKLKERAPSPLYGWIECICGKHTRYMHRVVLEMAQGSLGKKKAVMEARERDRERKRQVALKLQMVSAGANKRMVDNAAYIDRLDLYLVEHCQGNRTPSRIKEAMEALELIDQVRSVPS